MLFRLLSVVALGAASVIASSTPTLTRDINPPLSAKIASYNPIPQGLTNAKRLAAGYPLKPPTRRYERASRPQPSGFSGQPNNVARGYIECHDQNGNSVGFICKDQNSLGQYGVNADGDESTRLLVTIDLGGAAAGPCNIQTLNGPDSDLPYFGGLNGLKSASSNIFSGSNNHFFIGGTTQTSSRATPSIGSNSFSKNFDINQEIESAIWQYDASTNNVSPQWVNSDSSKPTTSLGLLQNALIGTGDKNAFENAFGSTTWVSLRLVHA